MDEQIFYCNSKLNKNRLREAWVSKNISEYPKILNFQKKFNQEKIKFSQVLYNYINSILEIPKCNKCNSEFKRFIGFNNGYDNYCSRRCALSSVSHVMIEKRIKNTREKWGVDHTSQLQSVKQKQAETNLERWGSISPSLNPTVLEKQKRTMLERYGVEFSGLSQELLQKSLNTRFEKYKKRVQKRYEGLDIKEIPCEGILKILCSKCQRIYEIRTELLSLRYFRYKVETCLYCNPIGKLESAGQIEIAKYLEDIGMEVELSNRKILNGREIDIFLPLKNIAIEFNGLYWHSELFKSKDYHLKKKEACEKLGINLINIWEDDWMFKKEIVISRINNLIGLNNRKIYARKCELKEVTNQVAKDFFEINHLQGSVNSPLNFGLYYEGELISVMSFGKLRKSLGQHAKKASFEMYRFCNKLNLSCVGGFSRLLNHFIKDFLPQNIITYANRDWSILQNVYEKNGFVFDSFTPINYWYFDKSLKRNHRFKFRKDKVAKDLKNKTEKQLMSENGWYRIYDCGSIKYNYQTHQ